MKKIKSFKIYTMYSVYMLVCLFSFNYSLVHGQNRICIFSADKSSKELTKIISGFQNNLGKSLGYIPVMLKSYNSAENVIIIEKNNSKVKQVNYQSLGEDGFVIQSVKENQVIISANTDWGIELATYYFMERFLNVKWLYASQLWTNQPRINNFRIPKVNVIQIPNFITRRLAPINPGEKNDLGIWGRHLGLRQDVQYNHNLFKIFKETSDFAPKVNGKAKLASSAMDQSWQPNFKAKGIDSYSSRVILDYFRKNPSAKSYSLGVNDSRMFDQSNSNGLRNHLGLEDYSDAYYSWVKKTVDNVNKSYPNKKYGLLAYNNVASPPNFKLPNNVIPFITYERLRWVDSELKMDDINILNKWKKVSNEIGWYDYIYGANYIVPRPYFTTISDYLKFGKQNNVRHYTAELYTNLLDAPKAWIVSKLLWNTDLSSEDLLNEWCAESFGREAAVPMKEFYTLWEKFWTNNAKSSKWWNLKGTAYLQFNNLGYLNLIPSVYMERSSELLQSALAKASDNTTKSRINQIIDLWDFSRMNYVYFNKSGLKNMNKSSVTKATILKKINLLQANPLNNTYISFVKKYNKY